MWRRIYERLLKVDFSWRWRGTASCSFFKDKSGGVNVPRFLRASYSGPSWNIWNHSINAKIKRVERWATPRLSHGSKEREKVDEDTRMSVSFYKSLLIERAVFGKGPSPPVDATCRLRRRIWGRDPQKGCWHNPFCTISLTTLYQVKTRSSHWYQITATWWVLKNMKGAGEPNWDYEDALGGGLMDLSRSDVWTSKSGKEHLEFEMAHRLHSVVAARQSRPGILVVFTPAFFGFRKSYENNIPWVSWVVGGINVLLLVSWAPHRVTRCGMRPCHDMGYLVR